jgi:hypothetical protein
MSFTKDFTLSIEFKEICTVFINDQSSQYSVVIYVIILPFGVAKVKMKTDFFYVMQRKHGGNG